MIEKEELIDISNKMVDYAQVMLIANDVYNKMPSHTEETKIRHGKFLMFIRMQTCALNNRANIINNNPHTNETFLSVRQDYIIHGKVVPGGGNDVGMDLSIEYDLRPADLSQNDLKEIPEKIALILKVLKANEEEIKQMMIDQTIKE